MDLRDRLDGIRSDLATLRASDLMPRKRRFTLMRIGLELHNLALLQPSLARDIERLILEHNLSETDEARQLAPLSRGFEAMLREVEPWSTRSAV